MGSISNKIMDAWYALLNGNLSIDGTSVPVYRGDAPSDAPNYYYVIRFESSRDNSTNHSFVKNPVVITESVSRFGAAELIRDDIAPRIDALVDTLVKPTPSTHGLPAQSEFQIVSVRRAEASNLTEDDGTYRTNRLITRNYHRIKQD
jgi:hypothetical protein